MKNNLYLYSVNISINHIFLVIKVNNYILMISYSLQYCKIPRGNVSQINGSAFPRFATMNIKITQTKVIFI
jgi:hypothetical protein